MRCPDRSIDEGMGWDGRSTDGQAAFRLSLELAHYEIEDNWNQVVRKRRRNGSVWMLPAACFGRSASFTGRSLVVGVKRECDPG